ncbi:hypothetical protein D3C76_929450 [compost metagenome]
MQQLFFVATEHAEHGRRIALDQLPEAAFPGWAMPFYPALALQRAEKILDLARRRQPLVDGLAFDLAVIGMHVLAEAAFAFEHGDHFLVQVETCNHRRRARPQVIESIAGGDPPIEFFAPLLHRHQVEQRFDRLAPVTAADVVDGHVQGEVVRVDPQLPQFIGADQQVQRQLLIAEVVADHLGHEHLAALPQCELNRTLAKVFVEQPLPVATVVRSQQLAVDHHVILPVIAVAQLFQISAQQPVIPQVLPVLKHTGQPSAIDLLGRGHPLQEKQGMGFVREIPTWPALLARFEVEGIVARDIGAMLFRPCRQLSWRFGQITGELGGLGQLLAQELFAQRSSLRVVAEQQIVEFAVLATGFRKRRRRTRQGC